MISDTHGNQGLLRQILQRENNSQYIFHLGDYYGDMDNNADLTEGKKLIRVPGTFNSGYFSGRLPVTQEIVILGWKIGCLHDIQDLSKLSLDIDILLFGHTHSPVIRKIFDRIEINPGHLKNIEDRGNVASYALLQISRKEIFIEIREFNCNLREVYTLNRIK